MKDVVFENFTLQFDLDLYSLEASNATWDDIVDWMERTAHHDWAKFGVSYNERNSSFIASITIDGKSAGDPRRCTTSFGKSTLSAYRKLFYLVEYLNWVSNDEATVLDKISERTSELKEYLRSLK